MGRTFQNCIDNVAYTLLNIELLCDHSKTPWCNCKDAPKVEMKRNLPRDEDVIVPIIQWGSSTISGFELARMPGVVQFYRYSRGCKS